MAGTESLSVIGGRAALGASAGCLFMCRDARRADARGSGLDGGQFRSNASTGFPSATLLVRLRVLRRGCKRSSLGISILQSIRHLPHRFQ